MIERLLNSLPEKPEPLEETDPIAAAGSSGDGSQPPLAPSWSKVLTEPLRAHCVAPNDDTIRHAYDLYLDEIEAPLLEIEHEIADDYDAIADHFSSLKALVPGLVEGALNQHAVEYSHLAIDAKEK